MLRVTQAFVCVLPICAVVPAIAQDAAADYPNRPIKVVIPNLPAGETNTIARKLLEAVAPQLKQSMVFDHKVAGAGTVGTPFVAKPPPEGYTLLVGSASPVVSAPQTIPIVMSNPVTDL
ncbi:tripartite tricarboxylate transporter substrate-binding protein [Polaromonas hydrogenivorans]